jgi:hypothetical protein
LIRKAILKGTIFIMILAFAISSLTSMLTIKTGHRAKLIQGLYENTGKSYDVVFLGSSHMHGAMNPNVLWGEYGITSFNYATGGQPIDVTYYLLKEVLKKHGKPIVVVDLYYLGLTRDFGEEGYIRYVLDSMKLSKNKVEAVMNATPRTEWVNYLMPFIKYHSRWKELKEEDFKFDITSSYYAKGFDASRVLYGKEFKSTGPVKGTSDIPPKSEEYLNKIIDLSKKEEFKLVFVNVPHDYAGTSGSKGWHKQPAKMFNKVAEIAKENYIPFINYNSILDEIGFDPKKDMFNIGHLNVNGSKKVSSHIGRFLKENYELNDHRNDENYAQWKTGYNYFQHVEAAAALRAELDGEEYIEKLQNESYILIMGANNYNFLDKGIGFKKLFSDLGLDLNRKSEDDNYIAVINSNVVEAETSGSSSISREFVFENDVKAKVVSETYEKKTPSIVINNKEYANALKGLNIVVYDKLLNKVIDSIAIDGNSIRKNKLQ